MELTREELEKLANPTMLDTHNQYQSCFVADMARQLLVEMGKQKAWENAPEWATCAYVYYAEQEEGKPCFTREGVSAFITKIEKAMFRRELPKSPAREIAEKYENLRNNYISMRVPGYPQKSCADFIEAAINEYKESVK